MSQEEDKPKLKKKQQVISLFGSEDDLAKIKQFCEDEGLYQGRFLVKAALRHIEEVEHERIQKRLERLK